jgi:TolB-like protein
MQAKDAAGSSVLPRSRKTRAILAMLALAAPRPVLRSQLIALLWSRRDPQQARGSLRQSLYELQDSLGELADALLIVDRYQVVLRTTGLHLDLTVPDPATGRINLPGSSNLLDDLNGIDPAFDAWLTVERHRIGQPDRAPMQSAARPASSTGQSTTESNQTERLENPSARAGLLAEPQGVEPPSPVALNSGHGPLRQLSRQRRVRVGVAPFRRLGYPQAEPLAAGLTEEIGAALARFRWLACIPTTSFVPATFEITNEMLGRRLDLDVLLDGSVQQINDQVRVIIRLIDLRAAGEIVWSARFDRPATSVLMLQDEIAGASVAQLESSLLRWEGDRALAQPNESPTGQLLLRMAIPALFRLHRGGFDAAGEKLHEAVKIAPDNSEIYVWLTQWHLFALGQGWAEDVRTASLAAQQFASKALELAPDDARALTLAGHVRAFIDGRPDEALWLHERALSANPNLPLAWCRSAYASSYAGQHQLAVQRAEQARRISPTDPLAFLFEGALAVARLLLGEYEAAATHGAHAIALNPRFSTSFKAQLSALGHLGRSDEAADIRGRLLELEPRFSIDQTLKRLPIRQPRDRDNYIDGLRLGGLK